jgi:hypothetical protein
VQNKAAQEAVQQVSVSILPARPFWYRLERAGRQSSDDLTASGLANSALKLARLSEKSAFQNRPFTNAYLPDVSEFNRILLVLRLKQDNFFPENFSVFG